MADEDELVFKARDDGGGVMRWTSAAIALILFVRDITESHSMGQI
jgi:hypothetical protein